MNVFESLLEFFVSPILRAPTLGSMLMCFSAGLMGCLVFLEKRSLVGEALSHAAYPGIVLSVIFSAFFFPFSETMIALSVLLGAFLTAAMGLFFLNFMEKKLKNSSDTALCFVLSIFFGVGVLVASRLQVSHALWLHRAQVFVFGEAATMVDSHIFLYAFLALVVLLTIVVLFRSLELLHFDPAFGKTVGMPTSLINTVTYFLLLLAIVVGMRSVGVVLMSAMLIAPAVSARQWSANLKGFLALSAFFGVASGFLGNYFSVFFPLWIKQPNLSLPTGPMIVLSSTLLCLFSLFFAPRRGLLLCFMRQVAFRLRIREENGLKALYKQEQKLFPKGAVLYLMQLKGWVEKEKSGLKLTEKGEKQAEKLVRLHRLWEVYLVYMGQKVERVHYNAEEMEHLLTPEMEKELQTLLGNPQYDPHQKPIPRASL